MAISDLKALLAELAAAESNHDLDGLRAVRERIIAAHPHSAEAAEALYKVGLDALFRARDMDSATQFLQQAAQTGHPYWSAAARTSMALCYVHQKRSQKALFELRKVAYGPKPSAHSVTALSFMEDIFVTEQKPDEATKIRRDRVLQLEQLLGAGAAEPLGGPERGHYLHQLALALLDLKERGRAKAALDEALALGAEALGPDIWQRVTDAAKQAG
jgi:tetratricopeptide (TPR) repeat protein